MGKRKNHNAANANNDGISKLQSAGMWRVIEYRAKYARKDDVAISAADALLRTDKSVALSHVVSHRLHVMYYENCEGTDRVLEHIFKKVIDSGDVHYSYMQLFKFIRRFDTGSELCDNLCTMLDRKRGSTK